MATYPDTNLDVKEDEFKDELMLEDYGISDDNLEETYIEELESNEVEGNNLKQEIIRDMMGGSERSQEPELMSASLNSNNTVSAAESSSNGGGGHLGTFNVPIQVPGARRGSLYINRLHTVPGTRRGSRLLTSGDGYFYYLKHTNKKKYDYQCYKWNCLARVSVLQVNSNGFQRNPNFPWHNHDPEYFLGAIHVLRETIISRCERESLPLRTIFDEECNQVPDEISKHLNFAKLSSTLDRVRKSSITTPRLPKSVAEFHEMLISEEYPGRSTAINGKKFYRSNEVVEGKNNLVFLSENMQWLLEFAETLYMDVTYKIVPSVPGLKQLFVVMAIAYDHAFPICYALMESGTYSSYQRILSTIKQIVPGLKPEMVISDFDMDLMKAVKKEFPDAETAGSWWHYATRLLSKAKALGIGDRFLRNENIKKIIHMYMALPLLPPDNVEAGLEAARHFATEVAPDTLAKKFKFLFTYIQSQWIQRIGADCLSVWGHPARTSNDSEVFYVSLKKKMRRGKPTAWEFVGGLKNLENVWAHIPERLEHNQHSLRKKRKLLAESKLIKAAGKNLKIGTISEREFLSSVAEVISLKVNFPLESDDEAEADEVEEVERPPSPLRSPTPPPHTEAVTADNPVSNDVPTVSPGLPLVIATTTPSYIGVIWTDGSTASNAVNTTNNGVNAVTTISNFTTPTLACLSSLPAISTPALGSFEAPNVNVANPLSTSAFNTPVGIVANLPSVIATNTPIVSVSNLPSVVATNTSFGSTANQLSFTNTPVSSVTNRPTISATNTAANVPSVFATNTPVGSVTNRPSISATNTAANLPYVIATNTPVGSVANRPSISATNTPAQRPIDNIPSRLSDGEDSEGVLISLKNVPMERRKKTEEKLLRLVKLISELDLDPDGVSFTVTTK